MNRRDLVCLELLRVLDDVEKPIGVEMLQAFVMQRPAVGALLNSEFDAAHQRCHEKRWIAGIRPELGDVQWHITNAGRAQLQQ